MLNIITYLGVDDTQQSAYGFQQILKVSQRKVLPPIVLYVIISFVP